MLGKNLMGLHAVQAKGKVGNGTVKLFIWNYMTASSTVNLKMVEEMRAFGSEDTVNVDVY